MSHTSSLPQSPGVYCITCTANSKIYIGSSVNVQKRWRTHRNALKKNRHANKHLQNAYNKYGEHAFVIHIVEVVTSENLIEREQYWLDTLINGNGFNTGKVAKTPMLGRKKPPVSPETRAKLSNALKGNKNCLGNVPSAETRAKISASNRGKKHSPESRALVSAAHRGRKLTPEHRAKISAGNKGKEFSPEHREKISIARKGIKLSPESIAKRTASREGWSPSPEQRIKLSLAAKGRKQSPEWAEKRAATKRKTYIVTTPDGVEITVGNLGDFCRLNDLNRKSMSRVASGKRRQYKGWKCRLVET